MPPMSIFPKNNLNTFSLFSGKCPFPIYELLLRKEKESSIDEYYIT